MDRQKQAGRQSQELERNPSPKNPRPRNGRGDFFISPSPSLRGGHKADAAIQTLRSLAITLKQSAAGYKRFHHEAHEDLEKTTKRRIRRPSFLVSFVVFVVKPLFPLTLPVIFPIIKQLNYKHRLLGASQSRSFYAQRGPPWHLSIQSKLLSLPPLSSSGLTGGSMANPQNFLLKKIQTTIKLITFGLRKKLNGGTD